MFGLVLEGGGSKGAYQIGACRALTELGVEISAVAGTSVGALNGAMVVQGDIEKAYELWHEIKPDGVIRFNPGELTSFGEGAGKGEALHGMLRKVKKVVLERGLDVEPLIQLVRSTVDEERIRKSPVHFGVVTVDLTKRKAVEIFKEDIPEGKLIDYIVASASFPAFKPARIDGKTYIDGGFYNALPVNLVKEKGCTDIIVIRTFSLGVKRKFDPTGLNLINIVPSENLGPILDFSCERSRKNLKMGYYDALRVFHKYKGRKYYIEPLRDEEFFIRYLTGLSEEKIARFCRLFGMDGCPGRRVLFEFLVPKVADLLDLPEQASYEDVAVGLLEWVAEACGTERFRVYTVRELYREIAGRYHYDGADWGRDIPGFLRSREIITRMARERIIAGIAGELFGTVVEENHAAV